MVPYYMMTFRFKPAQPIRIPDDSIPLMTRIDNRPNLFMHGTVIYLTVTASIVTGPMGDFDRQYL